MEKRNSFLVLKVYKNNCSNGGGTLELPYSIRFFHRVKIRMEYRDSVLFFSKMILCVRTKKIRKE